MNIEAIKKEFVKYTNNFNNLNYDINYKFRHSFRVMNISTYLSRSLNLSESEVNLATVIGLLHDIGRFKQVEIYDGYSDQNIDHGDLGVKILFEENLINNFKIDEKYYDIINFSIKNHNKLCISNTNNQIELLQAKIIRDADKIDILRAFTIYKDYNLIEVNEPITKEVSNRFFNRKCILKKDIKNKNDEIILKLSLIFDINFDEAIELIYKDNIINFIGSNIKNKDLFEPYFEYVQEYINERNDKNVRKKIQSYRSRKG